MKNIFVLTLLLLCSLALFSQNNPITVTAPNGGESWAIGSTHVITWTAAQLAGNVRIQLRRGMNSANVITIAENIPIAAGNFSWTLPANLAVNAEYKIRVFIPPVTPTGVLIADESDGFFAITGYNPPPMSLTLTSPNGGENWVIGTMHPITWNSTNLTGNIKIILDCPIPTYAPIVIAEEVPIQNGVFYWTVGNAPMPASFYKVSITWISDMTVYIGDISDAEFTISGSTNVPSLTVTSPNGGESWEAGSTHNITWTSANVEGNIRIDLVSPLDCLLPLIVEATPVAAGFYAWTIPASIPPASFYRIMITKQLSNGTIFSDISDGDFTISGEFVPMSITVTAPNGGENWEIGSTHQITWTSTGLTGNVRIELMSPVMNPLSNLIATEIPIENGVFNWTIPNTIQPASFYRVAITWLSIMTVYIGDGSDADFTISGTSQTPSITVTSPNGGENWTKGTMHPITWTSTSVPGNVQIRLVRMTSAGSVSRVIARNVPNTGIFNWQIPLRLPVGSGYKIVVRSQSTPTVFDRSDAPFTLSGGNINPFTVTPTVVTTDGQVSFMLSSDENTRVTAAVYNIKGQCISKLMNNEAISGKKTLSWNGQTSNGTTARKGIYFLKVQSGKEVITKKFLY